MNLRILAAVSMIVAAGPAFAQGEPPYAVSLQAIPNDSTSLTLTWRDGWWNGFASAMPLEGTEILGSTTAWEDDIDAWANTVAQPMTVEGAIPPPSLEPGPGSVGTPHSLRLIGLQDGATYYVVVRGIFGGPMAIGEEGSAVLAVPHDPGPPGDPVLSVSAASPQSLQIQWIVPGDDASGPGQAASPVSFVVGLGWVPPGASIANWITDPNTLRISGASLAVGQHQVVTFNDLNPASTYYVAIRVSDEVGQASLPATYLVAATLDVAAGSDSSGCPLSPASGRGLATAAVLAIVALLPATIRR